MPTTREKLAELSAWPIFAAAISLFTIILIGFAIFLSNKWSIIPIGAAILFLVVLGMNPVGRYFRLLVSTISSWAVVIGGRSIDFGINFEALGFAWLKANEVPTAAHLVFFGLVVVFVIADLITRQPHKSKGSPVTAKRLEKHKLNLRFLAYLATLSTVIATVVIVRGNASVWNPLSNEPIYEQEVTIHRVADFRQSGCDKNGSRKDLAIFRDTVTLAKSDPTYFAFAIEDFGQYVDVYDMSKNENIPVKSETRTMIYGKSHLTYPISVNSSNQAKVKYVWKDAHYYSKDPSEGMLGIASKSYLKAASAQIFLPSGESPIIRPKPFDSAYSDNCKTTADGGFNCTNLKNPDVILYSFGWKMWANCQSN